VLPGDGVIRLLPGLRSAKQRFVPPSAALEGDHLSRASPHPIDTGRPSPRGMWGRAAPLRGIIASGRQPGAVEHWRSGDAMGHIAAEIARSRAARQHARRPSLSLSGSAQTAALIAVSPRSRTSARRREFARSYPRAPRRPSFAADRRDESSPWRALAPAGGAMPEASAPSLCPGRGRPGAARRPGCRITKRRRR
jgi:hypothetical protein